MVTPVPFTIEAPGAVALMQVPLDRVTGLTMDAGGRFALKGRVTAALDGTSFDAARIFDFGAGGLRVLEADPSQDAYVLAVVDDGHTTTPGDRTASACAATHAPTPCLVPRLAELAHERLHTAREFAAMLSGGIELQSLPSQASTADAGGGGTLGAIALLLTLVGLAAAAIALARRLARDSMRRVRVAARRALQATRGDETLAPVRPKIHALVDRARYLDGVRRACARTLRRVDMAAVDRNANALSAERVEAGRLANEIAAATTEIERIESALRVVTLRAGTGARSRELAGASPELAGADPVDALVAELDFREQALAEANVL